MAEKTSLRPAVIVMRASCLVTRKGPSETGDRSGEERHRRGQSCPRPWPVPVKKVLQAATGSHDAKILRILFALRETAPERSRLSIPVP